MNTPHLDWTELQPGPGMLALHVIAQAKADLDRPALRADALAFLRGEEDSEGEALLPFWAELAGVDWRTITAYVRHEKDTLEDTARHKVATQPPGAVVALTGGELKALIHEGAVFLGEEGKWGWQGYTLMKEIRGATPPPTATDPVDDCDEDCPADGVGLGGICATWETEGLEGSPEENA